MQLNRESIFFESETSKDNVLKKSLTDQLFKMEERWKGANRADSKYIILKDFLKKLENESFFDAFPSLRDYEKHAIITRLQNETERFGGSLPAEEIEKLEEETYGKIIYKGKERINLKKIDELENILQEMNAHIYE